jgi:DNA-damage-inducible protein J
LFNRQNIKENATDGKRLTHALQARYNGINIFFEVILMAQTMVNFRIDEDIKKGMERACKDMGLSITAAFTIFATKVSREQKIPFEVSVDPFYSEENMARLKRAIADADAGRNMAVHELITVDDDEVEDA